MMNEIEDLNLAQSVWQDLRGHGFSFAGDGHRSIGSRYSMLAF
ncbi:hypothetical protein [Paracoccus methylarcula]|nr:hypothetical protein [Paracoccus methylarcula]